MKYKLFFTIAALLLLSSCVSIKKYNLKLGELKDVAQLKSDVDFVYKRLQKLHPDLYAYISKSELDFKFDSLKLSLSAPMSTKDLFFKLSPIVALVRQGHMNVIPIAERRTRKKFRDIRTNGLTPLSQYKYEIIDDKLLIVGYNKGDSSIRIGTELIEVNNEKPHEIFSTYRNTFSSDGYNTTHINYRLAKEFPDYYYLKNGEADSLVCRLKLNDSIITTVIRRNLSESKLRSDEFEKQMADDKKNHELRKRDKPTHAKPVIQPVRSLTYAENDSSIAIMKIRKFSTGNVHKFYRESFSKLRSLQTKYLILDLRNNPGGNVLEASELYAYLTDSSYCFLDKSEVASKTSILHTPYFKGQSVLGIVIRSVFLPLRVIPLITDYFRVKRNENGNYYYSSKLSRWNLPKEDHFKGKLYVLINGGSFSASCLLSSNLKGSERATFIGEETGGAYNGCVAGKTSAFILPQSKLIFYFGLMHLIPHHKTGIIGHGIYPDVEIKPTIQDRMNGYDPELNWILKDIKK